MEPVSSGWTNRGTGRYMKFSRAVARLIESRRDQEEGGELDSYEEASPEEIKRREVSWTLTKKLARKRSRGGR